MTGSMNGNKKVLSLSARRSAKAAESAVPLRFSGKGVVAFIYTRLSDYSQLIKLRLTLLVVFSAGIGLVLADVHAVNANDLLILLLSGFLITGSANGINQVIERKPDKLMARTLNRPVATGRLSVREAIVVTTLIGMSGAVLLGVYANPLSALTGVASLLLYAFVYTPLKRYTPLSVVAGAFTGAAPPIIGYTSVTGTVDGFCLLIFALQFIWQFPHFWALAWMLNEDYNRAGFRLLPSRRGKDGVTAMYILISTGMLILLSIYLFLTEFGNPITDGLILLLSAHFTWQAWKLFRTRDNRAARALMFGSFYYLPLVQILMVIGQMT